MIKTYINGVDKTDKVEYGSISISQQLNNRRNTAKFRVVNADVEEAQIVQIFRGSTLVTHSSSLITLDDTLSVSSFFYAGKKIIVGYKSAKEEIAYIQSISGNTLTLTKPLRQSHDAGELVGEEIFAGVTLKNPTEEIGKSGVKIYSVDATDYSTLMDQKVIVDTYEDMYAREIIGRIVYDFTANDHRLDLNECEVLTGITTSGVAITPTLSNESIYKLKSINLGATGAGVATFRIPVEGGTKDLSIYDRIRLWLKLPELPQESLSKITIRAIDSTGDMEWQDGVVIGPGWSYDSFDFNRASWVGGTPNLGAISHIEIELTTLKAIPLGDIKIDRIMATAGGFTLRGVENGNIKFKDVRAQYKKPSVFIEQLAKNNGFFWYVDTSRDLQFFASENREAPFSVSNTSTNFGRLKVTADITNLKNRQTVRGGKAPDQNLYIQEKECDGVETSFRLDYPPKDIKVYTKHGGGYIERTLGIENLNADTDFDFVFNFNEKTLRNASFPTIAKNDFIKIEYFPYKDIRVQTRDQLSIDLMRTLLGGDGIFDGAVISDGSIKTFDEARARARAEIKAYSNAILSASFETEQDGLEAGQVIRITYDTYGVDADFVIQKLDARQKTIDGPLTYSVSCGSSMYGLTEFFQYLLKRDPSNAIDVAEVVDVVETFDEVLTIGDQVTPRKKGVIFYAHSRNLPYAYTLNFTEGGTPNDGYVGFSQVA